MKKNEVKEEEKTLEEKVEAFCEWMEDFSEDHPAIFNFCAGTIGTFIVIIVISLIGLMLWKLAEFSIVLFIFLGVPLIAGIVFFVGTILN